MADRNLNLWLKFLRTINYLPADKKENTKITIFFFQDFHFLIVHKKGFHDCVCNEEINIWFHSSFSYLGFSFRLQLLCWLQLYIFAAFHNEKLCLNSRVKSKEYRGVGVIDYFLHFPVSHFFCPDDYFPILMRFLSHSSSKLTEGLWIVNDALVHLKIHSKVVFLSFTHTLVPSLTFKSWRFRLDGGEEEAITLWKWMNYAAI